jgi:phage-related protein
VPSQAEIDLIVNATNTLSDLQRELTRIVNIAEATAPPIRLDVEVDKDGALTRVRSTLSSVTSGLGSLASSIGTAGAAAGTAAPLLAGVAAAAQQIIPAAAVATTGILAMQLATQTLKLGMLGVSDAITEAFKPDADAAKVQEALEQLSPAARDAAEEIIGLKDSFKDLQQGVQEKLFTGFADEVKALSTTVLPDVQVALNDTAGVLNQMAIGASQAAQALSASGALGNALKSATNGLEDLKDVPGQAVIAFGQLAAAAGPSFERITTAAAGVADKVSRSLSDAFKSGALESAINDAVDSIAQLGRVAGNVFGALGNIINAVSIDGQGLFGTLEQLTQGFEDVTGTDEFQAGLASLAETMALVYKTAGPLLAQALKIVADVLTTLAGPAQVLVGVLGDALGQVLDALGPVLVSLADAFGKLVVSLSPLITLAGELIAGILPVLTPLFDALGRTFEAMAPFIEQIANILGSILTPILAALPAFLTAVLEPFAQLAETLFPQLAEQLAKMAPDFAELGVQLGELVIAAAPILAQFAELIALIDGEVIPIIGGVLIGTLALLAKGLSALAEVFTEITIPIIQTFIDLLQGDFRDGNEAARENVRDLSIKVVTFFDGMVNSVSIALNRYVLELRRKAGEAATGFLQEITQMINNAVIAIAQLPGKAASALGNLRNSLFSAGASLIGGFIDGIQSKIGEVTSVLSNLTSKIPDWKGPQDLDKRLLTPSGEFIIDGLIAGFQKGIPRVKAELQGLTLALPQFSSSAPSSINAPGTGSMAAPSFFINIGGEQIDDYIIDVIQDIDEQNARTAAQGIRL